MARKATTTRKKKTETVTTPVKTAPTPRASATARERASENARFKRAANWQAPGQAKKVGVAAKKKAKKKAAPAYGRGGRFGH